MSYKIAVSGSANNNCTKGAFKKAYEVGRQIALHGHVLITGATIGVPEWATRGAKSAGGVSIGLSPAVSKQAHMNTYHLPTKYMDLIIYTGFDYSGRNMLMTRSCDAVITICGRIGTLNEFTTAFEDRRVMGVLSGTGGIEGELKDILRVSKRGGMKRIVFEADPKILIQKVIKLIRINEKQRHSGQREVA